jgi:ParB family chromosome partitioning protein
LTEVAINSIAPNTRQPRRVFDADSLTELAASIKQHGVLQPLLVRPVAEDRYELIAGERRLRASKLAGLETVPVVVRSAAAQTSLELALIENIQREDISAIESAYAYQALIEEFGLTQEEVAERVGKSRTAVANVLRLLRLPAIVQESVQNGLITEGHARALLSQASEKDITEAFYRVVDEGLSVRETEKLSQRKAQNPKRPSTAPNRNDHDLEEAIRMRLQSPVSIKREKHGGKIIVAFYSEEDLIRVIDALGVSL